MTRIVLDVTGWKSQDDFYDAILRALGSPTWHGRNLDALWDSLICDTVNTVKLPVEIVLAGNAPPPEPLRSYLGILTGFTEEAARNGYDLCISADSELNLSDPGKPASQL